MGRLGYYSKLSGQALQESDPPPPKKKKFPDRLICETVVLKNKKNPPLHAISQL